MEALTTLLVLLACHCIILFVVAIFAAIETRHQRAARMEYVARIEAVRARQTALMVI